MRALSIVFAGLFGAFGVAGAAYAAHGGEVRLAAIAAAIALVHAPALLGMAACAPLAPRVFGLGALLTIIGTVLFSGDLAARILFEERLFADAAPIGGGTLIAAWLVVAAGGLFAAFGRTAGDHQEPS